MMSVLFLLAILNLLMACFGYILVKRKKFVLSWFAGILGVLVIHFLFLAESPVVRMWALISTAFIGMKVVVATMQTRRQSALTFGQWLTFAFTWAGMRSEIFERRAAHALPGARKMIISGASSIFAGLLLVFIYRELIHANFTTDARYLLSISLLLTAFSLILHFGLLKVSAGVWRYLGVDAYPLFKKPLQARTLNEFWSRRWNIAFSEMTSITVFRPLKERTGVRIAMLAAFVFSGLLHELAISLPVQSGYGRPMLYFIIQGLAVIGERLFVERNVLLFQNSLFCKIWLLFWLIGPIFLLFHRAFVQEIVLPIADLMM